MNTNPQLELKKIPNHDREAEYMHQAMMNILEDLSIEREGNVNTQKAVMNILQELQDEISAKNRFLAILSHELRNPLAPITSALEYIKLCGVENNTVRQSIETIEHQFGVLTRLLKDLLDVARITSNKLQLNFEEICLQTIVTHAIRSTKPFIERKKHSLSISLPEEPVRLIADSLRLEQILVNLLSNAVKYTKPEGSIWLTAYPKNGEVVIVLHDTGIGISRQMLPQLFNLFTQQESSFSHFGGGLGVGLALVRSLVELHGGTVYAASDGPGKGSTFTVRLPFVPPSHAFRRKEHEKINNG